MNYRVYTGHEQQVLKVTVVTKKTASIRINVSDAETAHTVFTNRNHVCTGKVNFYVRMPLSPKIAMVQIYDEAVGDMTREQSDFTVTIEKMPLIKQMDQIDMKNPDIRGFVRFYQRFCYNAGWIEPGV